MKLRPSVCLHLALHGNEKTEFVHVWETGVEKKGFCESRISRAVLLLECALEEFPLYYFVTLFIKLREKNKHDFGYRF